MKKMKPKIEAKIININSNHGRHLMRKLERQNRTINEQPEKSPALPRQKRAKGLRPDFRGTRAEGRE